MTARSIFCQGRHPIFFMASLALAVLIGPASAFQLTFNEAAGGTFATDFNQNGPAAGNFYQNSAGGGIAGSNAVDLTSNSADTTAIYRKDSFDLSTGTASVTLSGYFRNQQGVTGGVARGIFQIGFASDGGDEANTLNSGTQFNGTTGTGDSLKNFVTARVVGDGSIEFQTGLNGTTTNSGNSGTRALTNGGIYFFTVSISRTNTTSVFTGAAKLYSSEANGVLTGTLVNSAVQPLASITSVNLTHSLLYTDSIVFAGFRAAGSSGAGVNGANLVDNFSATVGSATQEAITLFDAAPQTVLPVGGNVRLSWLIRSDATSAVIDQGIGDVLPLTDMDGVGVVTVVPDLSTLYSLSVASPFGSKTQTATVIVRPLGTFTANTTYINPGSQVTLTWKVRRDATVTLAGVGNVNASTDATGAGSFVVNPAGTTTYTLSATAGGSTDTATVTIGLRPQGQSFALIDLGATGGRPETGAASGQKVGAGANNTNALNLPPTQLPSDGGVAFTVEIDNINAAGTAVGGLDWRDRGDGPDAPYVRLVEDFVKNALGVVHVTLVGIPAGSYDVLCYHLDPANSQSANIRIFVSDALGTARNTGVTGDASYPGHPANTGAPTVAGLTTAIVDSKTRLFNITSNGTSPVSIYFDSSNDTVDAETTLGALWLLAKSPAASIAVLNVQRSVSGASASVAVQFTSTANRTYTVRTSPDLTDWSTVLNNALPATGAITTFSEPAVPLTIPRRYYRISENP